MSNDDQQWRKTLTAAQYAVLREEATERPFSSPHNGEHRSGRFVCVGCGQELFVSQTKFDSGSGWPSFWQAVDHAVAEQEDRSLGHLRTEVRCQGCGGHLGHVFPDGPQPTGLRYCMNGTALKFKPTSE